MSKELRAYLAHVDGLRTVAVLAVLLAHFKVPGFPGGFLGVDVFFVISGFLITRLILADQEAGGFRYGRFYIRRARRLLPAAVAVIAVSFAVLYPVMSERDQQAFASSVPYALFSVANFYFMKDIGYFDIGVEYKPLLHMWSLSVEEQFYIFWPTILLLTVRWFRRPLIMVSIMLVASVALAEIVFTVSPGAAYYMLPTRAFELLVGAVLAVWQARQVGAPVSRPWVALGALATIFASFLLFSSTSRLPGVISLAPCVATAVLIRYGGSGPVGALLRQRQVVWIGLISYSLYLVHWPLYVYVSYRYPELPPLWLRLALIPAAIGLAAASYYLVEKPFRALPSVPRPRANAPFLGGLGAIMAGCMAVAITLPHTEDILSLVGPAKAQAHQVTSTRVPFTGSPTGERMRRYVSASGPRVLVLGDSHAQHLIKGLEDAFVAQGIAVDLATITGCPPLFDLYKVYGEDNRALEQRKCKSHTSPKEALALSDAYDVVVLAGRWDRLVSPPGEGETSFRQDYLVASEAEEAAPNLDRSRAHFADGMARTVQALVDDGKRVVVLSQVPPLGNDLSRCRHLFPWTDAEPDSGRCRRLSFAEVSNRLDFADDVIRAQAGRPGVLVIVPREIFCEAGRCLLTDPDSGAPIYRDDNHLSDAGSRMLLREADERLGLVKFIRGT